MRKVKAKCLQCGNETFFIGRNKEIFCNRCLIKYGCTY